VADGVATRQHANETALPGCAKKRSKVDVVNGPRPRHLGRFGIIAGMRTPEKQSLAGEGEACAT